MTEYFDQLWNSPMVQRGWRPYSCVPTYELRFLDARLQQNCAVTWQHDKEHHVGGGYYSTEKKTTEWLYIPDIHSTPQQPDSAALRERAEWERDAKEAP